MGMLRKVWGVAWRVAMLGTILEAFVSLSRHSKLALPIFMLGLMVFAVAGKTLRDYEWPDGEHAGGVILVDWMFLAMGVVSVLLLVLQGFDFGQIGVPGRTALTWAYLVWGGVLLFVGIHDWLRLQSLRRSGHVTPRTKVHRESK